MPNILTVPFAPICGDRLADTGFEDAGYAASNERSPPTRVIEVGAVTAGIAVPEERGVRFFSSCRAFDRLDGTVFRSTEQAARAASVLVRSTPPRDVRQLRTG